MYFTGVSTFKRWLLLNGIFLVICEKNLFIVGYEARNSAYTKSYKLN